MAKTPHAAIAARKSQRQRTAAHRVLGAVQFKWGLHKPGPAAARGVRSVATGLARQAAADIAAALPVRSVRSATQAAVAALPAATLGATLANLELATGLAFKSAVSDAMVDALDVDGVAALSPNAASLKLYAAVSAACVAAAQAPSVFQRIPGNDRAQSSHGAVPSLDGFTTRVMIPALRELAVRIAARQRLPQQQRDHMVAERARLLVSPAGTDEQEQHTDGSGMFSVHFGVGESCAEAGTCFELGSHRSVVVRTGKRKRVALPPGGLVIALSNVRHAGSAVGATAQARVFSYVRLVTRGAPLYKQATLQRAGVVASFEAETHVMDSAVTAALGSARSSTRSRCSCCC